MKILGGQWRGRNFYMPESIRPTQNIVRKSMFDMLGNDLEDMEFLDLFAGSGAVGLEALSRGAKKVTFVEKTRDVVPVIQENLNILTQGIAAGGLGGFELLEQDAFVAIKYLHRVKRQFDVVFLDPPYCRDHTKKILKTLKAYDILRANSLVICEHSSREVIPREFEPFTLVKEKKYGKRILKIYSVDRTQVDQVDAGDNLSNDSSMILPEEIIE